MEIRLIVILKPISMNMELANTNLMKKVRVQKAHIIMLVFHKKIMTIFLENP